MSLSPIDNIIKYFPCLFDGRKNRNYFGMRYSYTLGNGMMIDYNSEIKKRKEWYNKLLDDINKQVNNEPILDAIDEHVLLKLFLRVFKNPKTSLILLHLLEYSISNYAHIFRGVRQKGDSWVGIETDDFTLSLFFEELTEFYQNIDPKPAFFDNVFTGLLSYLSQGGSLHLLKSKPAILYNQFYEELFNKLSLNLAKDIKVLTIIGAQKGGKSFLINYLIGSMLKTATGKCTVGIHCCLCYIKDKLFLVLDTEGLDGVENTYEAWRNNYYKPTDQQMTLLNVACSDLVIINCDKTVSAQLKTTLNQCALGLFLISGKKVNAGQNDDYF